MGRRSPTPLIEGSHCDNLVLGRETFPDRSRILLQNVPAANTLGISAGALDGMTQGSILAVYPPVGAKLPEPHRVIGHVMITLVDMTSATVEPCEYNRTLKPKWTALTDRSRCEVVFRDLGEQRLRVAVDPIDADGNMLPGSIRHQLTTGMRSAKANLVAFVESTAEADWLLRLSDREIQLVPAAGISDRDESGLRKAIARVVLTGGWEAKVMEDLDKVARARGLLRLSEIAEKSPPSEGLGLQVDVLDDNGKPIRWSTAGRTLTDGQQITLELNNTGRQSLDVTLLYVDSACGICCIFPDPNRDDTNRMGTGDQHRIKLTVNATTTGIENLVSIVARGEGQPRDYSFLAQPPLEQSKMRGGIDDPLVQLCESALFGLGRNRGLTRVQTQNYEVKVLTWRIKPKSEVSKPQYSRGQR